MASVKPKASSNQKQPRSNPEAKLSGRPHREAVVGTSVAAPATRPISVASAVVYADSGSSFDGLIQTTVSDDLAAFLPQLDKTEEEARTLIDKQQKLADEKVAEEKAALELAAKRAAEAEARRVQQLIKTPVVVGPGMNKDQIEERREKKDRKAQRNAENRALRQAQNHLPKSNGVGVPVIISLAEALEGRDPTKSLPWTTTKRRVYPGALIEVHDQGSWVACVVSGVSPDYRWIAITVRRQVGWRRKVSSFSKVMAYDSPSWRPANHNKARGNGFDDVSDNPSYYNPPSTSSNEPPSSEPAVIYKYKKSRQNPSSALLDDTISSGPKALNPEKKLRQQAKNVDWSKLTPTREKRFTFALPDEEADESLQLGKASSQVGPSYEELVNRAAAKEAQKSDRFIEELKKTHKLRPIIELPRGAPVVTKKPKIVKPQIVDPPLENFGGSSMAAAEAAATSSADEDADPTDAFVSSSYSPGEFTLNAFDLRMSEDMLSVMSENEGTWFRMVESDGGDNVSFVRASDSEVFDVRGSHDSMGYSSPDSISSLNSSQSFHYADESLLLAQLPQSEGYSQEDMAKILGSHSFNAEPLYEEEENEEEGELYDSGDEQGSEADSDTAATERSTIAAPLYSDTFDFVHSQEDILQSSVMPSGNALYFDESSIVEGPSIYEFTLNPTDPVPTTTPTLSKAVSTSVAKETPAQVKRASVKPRPPPKAQAPQPTPQNKPVPEEEGDVLLKDVHLDLKWYEVQEVVFQCFTEPAFIKGPYKGVPGNLRKLGPKTELPHCDTCQMKFSSRFQLSEHLGGRVHRGKVWDAKVEAASAQYAASVARDL